MTMSCLRDPLGHLDLLPIEAALRRRPGVATPTPSAASLSSGFLQATSMNLAPSDSICSFTVCRTSLPPITGAQALGVDNRLKTGHADTRDDHSRSFHRTSGSHEHPEEALVLLGIDKHLA
jgi:hypothetical protein